MLPSGIASAGCPRSDAKCHRAGRAFDEEAVGGMALNPLMKYMARQMARAQFLYLPFSIFTSETDLKFMDTLLRRKSLLAE